MDPVDRQLTALLLDVDGTLLDTREFIFRAYEAALAGLGLPVPTRAVLARAVGLPLHTIYADFAGTRVEEAVELHRSFQEQHLDLARPFPGAADALAAIAGHGIRMAAVTSRSRRTSVRSLELAALDTYLEAVVSAEDASALKPDPAPIRMALDLLGANAENAAMAGDTRHDIEPGRALGMLTIGVTYGFHGDDILAAEPDVVIRSIDELPRALGLGRG